MPEFHFYPLQSLSSRLTAERATGTHLGVVAFRMLDHPEEGAQVRLVERDLAGEGDGADDPLATVEFRPGAPPSFELQPPSGDYTFTLAILLPGEREPSEARSWEIGLSTAAVTEERDHRLEIGLLGPGDDWSTHTPALLNTTRPGPAPGSGEQPDDPREWTGWRTIDRSTPIRNLQTDERRLIRHGGERPPEWRPRQPVPTDGPTLHGYPIVYIPGRNEPQRYFLLLNADGSEKLHFKPIAREIRGANYAMGFGLAAGGHGGEAYEEAAAEAEREYVEAARAGAEDVGAKALEALVARALLLFAEGNPSSVNTWDNKVYTLAAGYAGARLTSFLEWGRGRPTVEALVELPWFEGYTNHLAAEFPPGRPDQGVEQSDWSEGARRARLDLPSILYIRTLFNRPEHQATFARFWLHDYYQTGIVDTSSEEALRWGQEQAIAWWEHQHAWRPAWRADAERAQAWRERFDLVQLRGLVAAACYLRHGGTGPEPLDDVYRAVTREASGNPSGQLAFLLKANAQRHFRRNYAGNATEYERTHGRKVDHFVEAMREDRHDPDWTFQYDQVGDVLPALRRDTVGERTFHFRPEPVAERAPRWPDPGESYPQLAGHVWFLWGRQGESGVRAYDYGEEVEGIGRRRRARSRPRRGRGS